VQERREEKRRRGHAKRRIRFWSTSTPIKTGLLFPSSPTDFPLCIGVLENLLLFSLYFGCSQNHLGWFVEKHRSEPRTGTQTRLTTRPLEPSSPLENITTNDLRRSIETIDRPPSTLIRPHIDRLEGLWRGSVTSNVRSLMILLTSSIF